jgi:cell division protein ZipA
LDIKDFILISGGLLIALVIGHGFWIAWRAKREPLRMDIVPDLIPDHMDDMERLRGELPNGGARVVNRRGQDMEQTILELDAPAPLLMDVASEPDADEPEPDPLFTAPKEPVITPRQPMRREARMRQSEPKVDLEPREEVQEELVSTRADTSTGALARDAETAAVTVKDVDVAIVADARLAKAQPKLEPADRAPLFGRANRERAAQTQDEQPIDGAPVEELLILNVLASKGSLFSGEGLVSALRAQGLKYGDMNIFHQTDPATKAKLFSVANAVEPGTFDLADIDHLASPGISFFLQLPGPDNAIGAFDMMLEAARNVALDLGGEVKDEQLSVLTGQTAQHMRQRIADFARRRLSKRA